MYIHIYAQTRAPQGARRGAPPYERYRCGIVMDISTYTSLHYIIHIFANHINYAIVIRILIYCCKLVLLTDHTEELRNKCNQNNTINT